ncbi:hypothetical protein MKEN_01347900 [Mycena kentingensis (nom. inval.)]|nr:hypothetical protein MKEN_01347900 [Mycena kentingensis (nom. inval.)]
MSASEFIKEALNLKTQQLVDRISAGDVCPPTLQTPQHKQRIAAMFMFSRRLLAVAYTGSPTEASSVRLDALYARMDAECKRVGIRPPPRPILLRALHHDYPYIPEELTDSVPCLRVLSANATTEAKSVVPEPKSIPEEKSVLTAHPSQSIRASQRENKRPLDLIANASGTKKPRLTSPIPSKGGIPPVSLPSFDKSRPNKRKLDELSYDSGPSSPIQSMELTASPPLHVPAPPRLSGKKLKSKVPAANSQSVAPEIRRILEELHALPRDHKLALRAGIVTVMSLETTSKAGYGDVLRAAGIPFASRESLDKMRSRLADHLMPESDGSVLCKSAKYTTCLNRVSATSNGTSCEECRMGTNQQSRNQRAQQLTGQPTTSCSSIRLRFDHNADTHILDVDVRELYQRVGRVYQAAISSGDWTNAPPWLQRPPQGKQPSVYNLLFLVLHPSVRMAISARISADKNFEPLPCIVRYQQALKLRKTSSLKLRQPAALNINLDELTISTTWLARYASLLTRSILEAINKQRHEDGNDGVLVVCEGQLALMREPAKPASYPARVLD